MRHEYSFASGKWIHPPSLMCNLLTDALGKTFFAAWGIPALRFVILLAPLTLVSDEPDTWTRLMLMAIWAVMNSRWVFTKAESDWRNCDFLAETLLWAIAACKVLNLSTQTASGWLVPFLCVHALATSVYLIYPTKKITPLPDHNLLTTIILSVLMGGQSVALILLDDQNTLVSTRSVLLLGESAVSVLLVTRRSPRFLQTWMLYQLCTWPFYYRRADILFAVCVYVLLAVVLMVLMEDMHGQRGRRTHGMSLCEHVLGYAMFLLGKLIMAPVLYLSLATVSACVLVASFAEEWYTSTATFPPELAELCGDITDILQTYIKPIWEFTGDPLVQEVLVPALSEVSLARLSIYRAINPLLPIFVQGRDGVSQTYTPSDELAALLMLLAGPLVVLVAVVASLFPRGGALIQSPVFWLYTTFASAAFLVLTQIATGLTAHVVQIIFVESEYSRVYTEAGNLALLSSAGLLFACFMMVMVASTTSLAEDDDEDEGYVQPHRFRCGKYEILTSRDRPGYSEQHGPLWCCYLAVMHVEQRIIDIITAPYVITTTAAVLLLIAVISSGKSPVDDFDMVKVQTRPPEFDWMQLTLLDQTSPAINTLTKLLINAIGPEVRLVPLILMGIRVVEGALTCLPCLCIPLGPLKDVAEDVADLFTRRRLLSTDDPWSFDPDHPCGERPASSCDGISICASDVFAPIAKLSEIAAGLFSITLRYVTQLLTLVFQQIPHFSDIDDAFSHITRVLSFVDFDFTQYADFSLPSLGKIALPAVHLPTFVVPSQSAAVVVACVFVSVLVILLLFGIAEAVFGAVVRATILSIIVSAWTWLLLIVVILFEARSEVVIFTGYQATLTFNKTVCIVYLVALALLAISTATFLAEVFNLPQEIRKKEAAVPVSLSATGARELRHSRSSSFSSSSSSSRIANGSSSQEEEGVRRQSSTSTARSLRKPTEYRRGGEVHQAASGAALQHHDVG
jgi:hypothetical protein